MSDIKKTTAVREASKELHRWVSLRDELELEFEIDPAELSDTLEGETDLPETLLAIADEVAERETMAEALGIRIKSLQERKARIEKTADTLRSTILQHMDIANIPKITGDGATLSITNLKPDVIIQDESLIPTAYWVPQDPKLDKKKLNAAIAEGEVIPGAIRGNGKISLTIRRK